MRGVGPTILTFFLGGGGLL